MEENKKKDMLRKAAKALESLLASNSKMLLAIENSKPFNRKNTNNVNHLSNF